MEGTTDKIGGKAREIKGRVTGDESEEAKGKAQQLRGDVKHTAGKARRKTQGKAEELKGKIRQSIP